MKKITYAIILVTITLLLTSYSLGYPSMDRFSEGGFVMGKYFESDEDIANARIEQVFETIQNRDKSNLKKMFSKSALNATDDFDESVTSLFDFFRGEIVSYDNWGGPQVTSKKNSGHNKKEMQSTYDVKTTEQKYRISIQEFLVDTENPDNVGVYSFSIIKAEDTDEEYAYWNFGSGIIIDQKEK